MLPLALPLIAVGQDETKVEGYKGPVCDYGLPPVGPPRSDDFIAVEREPEILDRTLVDSIYAAPDGCTVLREKSKAFVRVLINPQGKVDSAIVKRSPCPAFDGTLTALAKRLEFTPALQNKKPIHFWKTLPIPIKPTEPAETR